MKRKFIIEKIEEVKQVEVKKTEEESKENK